MGIFGGLYFLVCVVTVLLAIRWCTVAAVRGDKDFFTELFRMRDSAEVSSRKKPKGQWQMPNRPNGP